VKIGLLFGTFNPIHNGHLVIAGYFSEFSDLDEVWFIVSPHNPFKAQPTLLQDKERLKIVKLAVEKSKGIKVSDVEFSLTRPSYTINTLTYLQTKYPKVDFVLLMGEDNLSTFSKWKDYKKILNDVEVYTYPRPDIPKTKLHRHKKVKLFSDAPVMHLSSTFIRESIAAGKNVRYMLPEKVWTYITKKKFYRKKP
jgi:nicotinate-nucleotide adenylyltransferase